MHPYMKAKQAIQAKENMQRGRDQKTHEPTFPWSLACTPFLTRSHDVVVEGDAALEVLGVGDVEEEGIVELEADGVRNRRRWEGAGRGGGYSAAAEKRWSPRWRSPGGGFMKASKFIVSSQTMLFGKKTKVSNIANFAP